MRILITIIILLTTVNLTNAQEIIDGNYYDYFGSEIELKKDSTFIYSWRFDLSSSWTIGKWTINNDTIFLEIEVVFDTLRYYVENTNIQVETLVESIDQNSNLISKEEFALDQVTLGGQNRHEMPLQLFFKNNRLYPIDENGKLIKKKLKGFWTKKKYNPWYIRRE